MAHLSNTLVVVGTGWSLGYLDYSLSYPGSIHPIKSCVPL